MTVGLSAICQEAIAKELADMRIREFAPQLYKSAKYAYLEWVDGTDPEEANRCMRIMGDVLHNIEKERQV
jgi:hypothetical protein